MTFWDFFAAFIVTGGGVALVPYVGPMIKAHYARVSAEHQQIEEKRQEALQAAPRDRQRSEELKELIHRQTVAEQEKRTIKAEVERDMLTEALNHARANGTLVEAGLKQLALPSTPMNRNGEASTSVNDDEVEVTPPSGFRTIPGRRTR